MVRGRLHCRVVALIAAYAVALQALLTAFAPVALALGSADAFGVICAGAGTEPANHPSSHDRDHCGPACFMVGCGLPALPPSTGVPFAVALVASARLAAGVPLRQAANAGNPEEARAPPRV